MPIQGSACCFASCAGFLAEGPHLVIVGFWQHTQSVLEHVHRSAVLVHCGPVRIHQTLFLFAGCGLGDGATHDSMLTTIRVVATLGKRPDLSRRNAAYIGRGAHENQTLAWLPKRLDSVYDEVSMQQCSNCGVPTPLLYAGTPICLDCESMREDANPVPQSQPEAARTFDATSSGSV